MYEINHVIHTARLKQSKKREKKTKLILNIYRSEISQTALDSVVSE